MFLCRVSLIDIDCTSGWCYLGCDTCQKSMYDAPRKYKCRRCGPIKRPIYWYAVIATLVLNFYQLLKSHNYHTAVLGMLGTSWIRRWKMPPAQWTWWSSVRRLKSWLVYLRRSWLIRSRMMMNGSPCQMKSGLFLDQRTPLKFLTSTGAGASLCIQSWTMLPSPSLLHPLLNARRHVPPKGSTKAAVPTPSTTECKEEPAPEGRASMARARSKSTRLQKPNKRLRGDDWIN